MKKLGSMFLVVCGAVLAVATFYDASLLTEALGLSIEGGEAVVAFGSLSLSAVLILFGMLGFRKRPLSSTSQSAGQ